MAGHLDISRVILVIALMISALALFLFLIPSLFLSPWRAAMFIGEYPDIPPDVIESLRANSVVHHPPVQEMDWDQALKMWGEG